MEYSFDIFDKTPERLAKKLATNCRRRRLDKGMSRRSLSEQTGIPELTLERFKTKGKISLEAFLKLVGAFDWYDEMSAIMGKSKFTTGTELERINKNQNRQKGITQDYFTQKPQPPDFTFDGVKPGGCG